jgi:hypothetical protein
VFLIGNKCDLEESRLFSIDEGNELASTIDAFQVLETSALTEVAVDELLLSRINGVEGSRGNVPAVPRV